MNKKELIERVTLYCHRNDLESHLTRFRKDGMAIVENVPVGFRGDMEIPTEYKVVAERIVEPSNQEELSQEDLASIQAFINEREIFHRRILRQSREAHHKQENLVSIHNKTKTELDGKCSWCGVESKLFGWTRCVDAKPDDLCVYREACGGHSELLRDWTKTTWTRKDLYEDEKEE